MMFEISFNQYNLQVEDKWSDTLDVRQWTIGVCFEGKQACINERYDRNNITEIAGNIRLPLLSIIQKYERSTLFCSKKS